MVNSIEFKLVNRRIINVNHNPGWLYWMTNDNNVRCLVITNRHLNISGWDIRRLDVSLSLLRPCKMSAVSLVQLLCTWWLLKACLAFLFVILNEYLQGVVFQTKPSAIHFLTVSTSSNFKTIFCNERSSLTKKERTF